MLLPPETPRTVGRAEPSDLQLNDRSLSMRLRSSSPELAKIPAEQLLKEMPTLIAGTAEDQAEAGAPPAEAGQPGAPSAAS